jgi:aminoglycoside phosphotransferase (APT) family kinase protein
MSREVRVQSALRPVFPYVPEILASCDDPSVIGSDFYVMEHLKGFIPRKTLPDGIAGDRDRTRDLAFTVVDRLVDLHSVDPAAAGLADLGRGPGYVRRQVEGWSKRYRAARTRNVPSAEKVMSWLAANQPDDVGMCLIHNDFRLDNVVLDSDDLLRVIGILDWEMATIGDPLMDLGGALAYWVQADDDVVMQKFRRQPTNAPGMPSRREVVEYYCSKRGLDAANWPFYEVFGLFRLAVIVQQIYFRYHRKETTNPAFKNYWLMSGYLNYRCRKVIRGAR